MFLSAIFHLLSSNMFKIRGTHLDLIVHTFDRAHEMRLFVAKMIITQLRLGKMLNPLFEGPKVLIFPFLRELFAERFIYKDSENVYTIVRLLEKFRPKYQTDSSYSPLITRSFFYLTTHGKLDDITIKYYLRHLGLLIDRGLLNEQTY
jgi:hypothetical protein